MDVADSFASPHDFRILMKRRFEHSDALAVDRLSQTDTHLGRCVRSALDIIDRAIREYGDTLAISFKWVDRLTVQCVKLTVVEMCSQRWKRW